MSHILVRSESIDLLDRLILALTGSSTTFEVNSVDAPAPVSDIGLLWRDQPTGRPEVLMLDCAVGGPEEALELTGRLNLECPAVSVVLVAEAGSDLALPALRAGATDIVDPLADDSEFLRVVRRAADLAEVRSTQQGGTSAAPLAGPATGQVISVVSPKGGVGKTTVSTNLAVGLARLAPKATVLVDLDIQFGDVASGLNLDPEYFLPSAVQGQASTDTLVLKTFLTLHETGLYVICAPESPVEADGITADQVRSLLRTLASEFRYVVVDTAPGLSEHTLAAMDETTDLVMLSSMDVPGLRGLRKELDTLRELGLLQQRRHQVVVNFADQSAGLSVADIEVTIGASVDLLLPRSKAAPASVNLGVPLLQSGTRDPMTKQLRTLVEHFTREEDTDQPSVKVHKLKAKTSTPVPRRAASGWFRRPRAAAS
nr:AAA family ATPase [uncultured Friedmanniella sp.]